MSKKGKDPRTIAKPTANNFIEFAENNPNAQVTPNARGRFTAVENKAGEKTYIKPGNEVLDPQTRKNLIRWFTLLGFFLFIVSCIYLAFNPTFFHQFL